MKQKHWKRYYANTFDITTPYLAVGGTVFGPHDQGPTGRRSYVLAFAAGEASKDNNQKLAEALAVRLNQEPDIATLDTPRDLLMTIIRRHAIEVTEECGGYFAFNKNIFPAHRI